jgi:UDP-glucose 4-epimerase
VADVVRGNLLAMTADIDSTVVNLGSGTSVTVLELIDLVGEVTGRPVIREHGPAEAGDVPFTLADISRATEILGYRPVVDLRTGLRTQLAWLRDNDVVGVG